MKDFGEYIKSLGTEKFRSIVVHHGSYKTLGKFAKAAAEKLSGQYFDVMDYFENNPEMAIDTFDVEELTILLKEFSAGQTFLYIDKINFLLDSWLKSDKNAFYGLIKNGWNSYYRDTNATLVFFIQTYDELKQQKSQILVITAAST